MRRFIESYIIFLKEDLKIAAACKSSHERLLNSIKNKDYFSEELAAYFEKKDLNKPFVISPTDPSQVALLKKLLNCLEHTEKGLYAVENLDVSRERSMGGIVFDAAKISYHAINEVYAAIQLISHSSPDIQNIVGPHLNALMPQIALASKALGQLTPEHSEESAGAVLAGVVKMLPTANHSEKQSLENISSMIFEIPHYLEELQKIVSTGASGIATKSSTSGEEYQAMMIKKANDTKAKFDKLLTTDSKLSSITSYLGILKKLADLSSDLVNTAAPLTKQAYLDAADKLQEIKHTHLPQMISELEKMEESMGLKSGVLTGPSIKKMDEYYLQLSTLVDNIAQAADVLDTTSSYMSSALGRGVRYLFLGDNTKLDVGEKLTRVPNLLVMQDDQFNAQRKEHQLVRLSETRHEASDTQVKNAATNFFNQLSTYNRFHQAYCKWSLANVSEDEKAKLLKEYKQFQSHFAALHPDIDKLIVDALTKPRGEGIASRLYSSEYKQLWGSNHFTQVLSCKDAVLANIDQRAAQAKFKEQLIKKSMGHAEQTAYEALDKKTTLNAEVTPFAPVEYVFEENKPSSEFHKKVIALSNEITQVENAQKGANDFFQLLSLTSTSTDITLLDDISKENLRKAYKQFQPHLISMGYDDINQKLVQSLTSSTSTSTKPPLYVADLINIKKEIHSELATFLSNAKQDQKVCLDQEKAAKLVELEREPLAAQGLQLERKTLFGKLQDMKLSKSVDTFFTGKFQDYLKENLADVVWKAISKDGKLELNKLPYTEFHKDGPDVKRYKELINAVYHIKNGLEKLETLNDYGDPGNIVNRTRFVVTTFNALLLEINNSKYYLQNALTDIAGIPALNTMIQETVELLAPMKGLPLIGDYLKPTERVAPVAPKDYVEIWKEQQALVQAFFSPTPTKLEPVLEHVIDPEAKKPAASSDENPMVRLIAEFLYKIPSVLETVRDKSSPSAEQETQIKTSIDAFVAGLKGLSFGPDSVKKILSTLSKIEMQLTDIGVSGRETVLARLQGIRSDFGLIYIAAADEAEFNLGLKPGTYSSMVSKRFDLFYDSLISNMPLATDQHALELLVDVTHTQKRLQREEERLQVVSSSNLAENTKHFIFGDDFEDNNKIFNAYKKLKELMPDILNCDSAGIEGLMNFTQLRNEAADVYQEIQPYLAEADADIFKKNLISQCGDEDELNTAINNLFRARDAIYSPSNALTKIQQLSLDSDFTQIKDQEQFIKHYQTLQPYLNKLIYTYDNAYFLRELQTPKDFVKAAAGISGEVGKFQELVDGLEKEKLNKIGLAEERVTYLNNVLTKQINEIGPQKLAAFAEKVFDNYMKANVESALTVAMGSNAALFINHSMPDFTAKKEEILAGLTLKNDIEESIAARIDAIVPEIIIKNTDSFKQLIFNNNVNEVVKDSFKDELGIYTDVFFKEIAPAYEAEKERILKNIPLDDHLGSAVLSELNNVTFQALQKNTELKTAYIKLNTFVKELNQLMDENKANPNQSMSRKEALMLLSKLQQRLSDTSRIPDERTLEYLQQTYLNAQVELKAINQNHALIHIDDVLISLNTIINAERNKPPGNPCRDEKIKDLIIMQRFLQEPYHLPDDDTANFLRQRQEKVNAFMTSLPKYDQMIEIHDHLKKMETYVNNATKLSPEIKAEQRKLLTGMQSKLLELDKSPSERLADVKKEGLSEESHKTLNKNSEGVWDALCRGVNALLVKIGLKAPPIRVDQGKDLTSSFKNKLNLIKDDFNSKPKLAKDSAEEAANTNSLPRQNS